MGEKRRSDIKQKLCTADKQYLKVRQTVARLVVDNQLDPKIEFFNYSKIGAGLITTAGTTLDFQWLLVKAFKV